MALAHLRDYREAGLRRAWRTFMHALDDPTEEKLPFVRAPTLVVRGSLDAIVPQRWTEEAVRRLPRGRLAVIPGGPHVLNYTTPRPFVRLVRRFIEEGRRGEARGPAPVVGPPGRQALGRKRWCRQGS